MLAVAIPAMVMLRRTSESGAVNINNYNTANSSSNNTNKVDIDADSVDVDAAKSDSPTLSPASRNLAFTEQGEEAVHPAGEEGEEERVWKILDKAVHLRTPRERLAVDKWTMQQDPFQM